MSTWDAQAQDGAHDLPVHGGWQQPWQDAQGQWHYPYGAHAPADSAALLHQQPAEWSPLAPPPADPSIVAEHELAPVGPPRYAAPTRALRDPRQNTLAAVLVFVTLLVSLWAILGFLGAMTKTLTSISNGNDKLMVQLQTANDGLGRLDQKTSHLHAMSDDSTRLRSVLEGIDGSMGAMLTGVEGISAGMQAMDASLATLDSELATVNELNASMSSELAGINSGLAQKRLKVQAMRRDVVGTSGVIAGLPALLAATNGRLAHINGAVNTMGCKGITNNLRVKISVGPIPNGGADVFATVIPAGAWGTRADGSAC